MSRSHRARRAMIALAALLTLALLAGGAVLYARGQTAFPAPTGGYPVGHTDLHFVDHSRQDILGADPSAPRELMVTLYYPAAPTAGARVGPYAEGQLLSLVAADAKIPAPAVSVLAQPHWHPDAPAARRQGGFPVLLFEPGWGTPPIYYTAMLEDLASHGFFVAAVWPTDSVSFTLFPGGRVVRQTHAGEDPDKYTNDERQALPVRRLVADVWSSDARFVLDQLAELNRVRGRFQGRLDVARSGMFGHSFGGAVAPEVAAVDPRVQAAVNMDGAPVALDQAAVPITKPFLMMRSVLPEPTPDELAKAHVTIQQFRQREDGMYRTVYASARPGQLLTLAGSGHLTYASDEAMFARLPMSRNPDLVGTIDGRRAVEVTDAWLVAFFDRNVAGVPARQPLFSETSVQQWGSCEVIPAEASLRQAAPRSCAAPRGSVTPPSLT